MVKIEVGKSDSFWIAFVIVLVGVGFVYAYTVDESGDPAVMGHSADELEVSDVFCTKITGHACGYDDNGTGMGELDLLNGLHSSEQCVALGGVVESVDEGDICRMPLGCPGGWLPHNDWTTTESKTFYEACPFCIVFRDDMCQTGWQSLHGTCSVTGHNWGDEEVEICTPGSVHCVGVFSAPVLERGCY
ncbi:hypothetical protein HN903_00945 [archaeon]|jgi:hypothetical protein|nr:hypothetical protein [archaeon]MBT7128298.1 hypothetical protein [archaeon]